MKKQDGIALIATLLIMAAIMALGVGTLFLSTMNLKIAENSRTHAVARYNAEAGMEAAIVKLKKDYEAATPKQLPTSDAFRLPSSPDNTMTYEPIDSGSTYTTYSTGTQRTQARVVIIGTGPNSASYQSEMFIEMTSAGQTVPEELQDGLSTEGTCTINGSSSYTDSGVRCNGGFTLNGYSSNQFKSCTTRNTDGTCRSSTSVATADISVSGGTDQASYICNPSRATEICENGKPKKLKAPVSVNVNFRDRRDDAIAKALGLERYRDANMQNTRDETGTYNYAPPSPKESPSTALPVKIGGATNGTPYSSRCTRTYSSSVSYNRSSDAVNAGFSPGNVVCIAGGVALPDDLNLENVTVIADSDINFNGNSELSMNKTTLISRNGGVNLNRKITVKDSSIYSQTNLNYNGQQSKFLGNTTIASAGNININGSSDVARDSNSNLGIGLALIAGGDIEINGSSDWYAAAIAGGSFRYNGNATLYGSIAAKTGITANGGITIDTSFNIINTDLLTVASSELQVSSRR